MQQRTNSGIFKCCADRHVKALELTTGWTVRRLAIGTIVKFQLLGLRHKQSQDPEERFHGFKDAYEMLRRSRAATNGMLLPPDRGL